MILLFYTISSLTIIIILYFSCRVCIVKGRNCNLKRLHKKCQGKVIFVTGGTSGLGLSTVSSIVQIPNTTLILGCINENELKKIDRYFMSYREKSKTSRMYYLLLDLSSLVSISNCISELENILETKLESQKIHFLINNAGCARKIGKITDDGIEYMMSVNAIGHLLLTRLIIQKHDLMESGGMVVNVASDAHKMPPFLCYTNKTMEKRRIEDFIRGNVKEVNSNFLTRNILIHSLQQYGYSKLCVLWGTSYCHKLFFLDKQRKIRFNAVQPGAVNSSIVPRDQVNFLLYYSLRLVMYLFFRTPFQACQTTLHCLTLQENESGKYYAVCKEHKSSLLSRDESKQIEYWNLLDKKYFSDFLR